MLGQPVTAREVGSDQVRADPEASAEAGPRGEREDRGGDGGEGRREPGSRRGVRLDGVTVRLGGNEVLRDFTLAIEAGEFFSLLGPSGVGKSTLLNVVAGFVPVERGRVFIGDEDVTERPAHRRDIGFIFQDYALFPHLTVARNVRFPLEMRRVPKAQAAIRVSEVLRLVGLEALADRHPKSLSGGQRQRVAVARALVAGAKTILMDEPMSSLDRQLRDDMTREIRRLQRTFGFTVMYVTHDQSEALKLSERIGILRRGGLEQVGSPAEVYHHPRSLYGARLTGPVNLLRGQVVPPAIPGGTGTAGGGLFMEVPGGRIAAPDRRADQPAPGTTVLVGVRPDQVDMLPPGAAPPGHNRLPAVFVDEVMAGPTFEVTVDVGGETWILAVRSGGGRHPGEPVEVAWPMASTLVLEE